MDSLTHPGRRLSLSQLVFALNEELKRVVYCPSFTSNEVSQFDRDISTALVTIREWGNSFVPINRLPIEVLSLIPTHLSHEKDLFRASSVCRHWRRTFIQRASLWSRLDLTVKRSDFFVKVLLERAKGSALDISCAHLDRADILALLSLHAQQFRTLDFANNFWSSIQRFSEAVPGPLPLLHTLKINVVDIYMLGPIALETMDPPSLPFFNGAVNLKNLILHSERETYLNHFVFPNLTTFELLAKPASEEFPFSELLDFLEASPTLQSVHIRIVAETFPGDIPPERVVVLPNAEIFSVTQDEPSYGIAAHVSCPSARLMSFVYEQDVESEIPQEIFPTSSSWNAVGPQYMASTINEIVLGITAGNNIIFCSLSFSFPGLATLELGYRMITGVGYYHESSASLGEKHSRIFSRALKAVRKHPLLNKVKRLRIQDSHVYLAPHHLARIATEAARLFEFASPLEELTLDVDNLRPFISPFFDLPESQVSLQPHTFPSIKGLTIAEHPGRPLDGECVTAIVGFVKSQHMRGVPLERAIFQMEFPPTGMAERLKPWVGTVHFSEVNLGGDQGPM